MGYEQENKQVWARFNKQKKIIKHLNREIEEINLKYNLLKKITVLGIGFLAYLTINSTNNIC